MLIDIYVNYTWQQRQNSNRFTPYGNLEEAQLLVSRGRLSYRVENRILTGTNENMIWMEPTADSGARPCQHRHTRMLFISVTKTHFFDVLQKDY